MASELKPCPFCGAAAKAKPMGATTFTVMCENLHRINLFASKDEAVAAWNTRPAPAATDTGLETVGNITEECLLELKQMLCGEIHPCNDIGDVTDADIELVTRSQAEELLAAERADKRIWMEKAAIEAERVERLEADNAAKDARIKELEQALETEKTLSRGDWACQREVDQMSIKTEALEAKLAAAGMALKRADEALQLDAKASGHTYVKLALAEVRS